MPTQNYKRQYSARIQGNQGPKDAASYLKQLESLLKRNTGQGLFQGQDVSSNNPMYIPGKVANPTGLSETPSTMTQGSGMVQPQPVQRQQPIEDQGEVLGEQTSQPTIEEFLQQFNQSYAAPENQSGFGDPRVEFIASTADGGSLMSDGTIVYDDGTIREGDPGAQSIASDMSGGIRYSDGSLRRPAPNAIRSIAGNRERIGYDDGSARWGQYQYGPSGAPVSMPGGQQGLISGLLGQLQPVTQAYGNYNPQLEPGSGYNLGTDVRTKDLAGSQRQLKLPVGAEVVEVLKDDGTQWGDISGHQGYGNSVLVRLATGEMLRFSHLAQMANLQPGMRLEAGQVFGTPGTTGNTQGEHLDLEYYDQQGNISDPSMFTGFSDPQGLRTPLPGQAAPGTKAPSGSEQISSQAVDSIRPSNPIESVKQNVVEPIAEAVKNAPKNVFNAAKQANPIQAELGIGEGIITPEAAQARVSALSQQPKQYNPYRQLVGNVTERVGDTIGFPEGVLSEALAGGATKRTNQALASEIGGESPQIVPGIRQNIKDIGSDINQKAQGALSQAGQGIKSLTQTGIGSLGNIFKPSQATAPRAVGDVSGTAEANQSVGQFSSVMDSAPSMSSLVKNDIRDPFFKSGAVSDYQQYLKPGALDNSGGALTLDLFNDAFYQNPDNVTKVFAGTSMQQPAQQKYEEYLSEKRRQEEAQKNVSLDDYLRMGKTAAQFYAETGRQSEADRAGGADKAAAQSGSQMSSSQAQQNQSAGNPGSTSVTLQSGKVVTAPPGQKVYVDSSGNPQLVSDTSFKLGNTSGDFNTPNSQGSAQVNSLAIPRNQSANVFSKTKSFLSNIFRR